MTSLIGRGSVVISFRIMENESGVESFLSLWLLPYRLTVNEQELQAIEGQAMEFTSKRVKSMPQLLYLVNK